MSKRIVRAVLALTLTLVALPAFAQSRELPAALWYAVIWARGQDHLHWINPDGIVASIARPVMDQEADDAALRLGFSRDGRFLLQAGKTLAGNEVLGIYDLQSGSFTASIAAQTGIEIILGDANASNAPGSRAAVVFAAADAGDDSWQIIAFDLVTGAAIALLDDSQVSLGDTAQPMVPRVRLYETRANAEQDIIHFQLLPKVGERATPATARAWLPGATAATFLQSSPYARVEADINYKSGAEIFTFEHEELTVSAFSASDAADNAVAKHNPASPGSAIVTLLVDQQRYLSSARWAKDGEWVALFGESGEQGVTVGWHVLSPIDSQMDRRLVALPVDVRQVVGTPDGLLTMNSDGHLRHVNSLADIQGQLLHAPDSTEPELIQIVYVSAISDSFALSSLAAAAEN